MQTPNICDFSVLYNDQFKYPLPQEILQKQRNGMGFGEKTPYTSEEQTRIQLDANQIFQSILARKPVSAKTLVVTAGAPGAGKTTLLEAILENDQPAAYTDPDAVCLKNMISTYREDVKTNRLSDCYTKWRSASNFVHNCILAHLVLLGKKIYFGTTATGDKTHITFSWFKDQGYKIHLIHLIAPDQVRWKSIRERDKNFMQTTEKDCLDKGKLFPQRISDTYLKYADQIDFFFRNVADEDATLTATWKRNEALSIHDPELYQQMVKIHNAACKTLQSGEEFLWENTVEKLPK